MGIFSMEAPFLQGQAGGLPILTSSMRGAGEAVESRDLVEANAPFQHTSSSLKMRRMEIERDTPGFYSPVTLQKRETCHKIEQLAATIGR